MIKGLFNPIMWENMNKSILERSPLNAISVTKHSDGPKIERWGVHLIVSPICNIWKHKISSLSKDQYQSIVADDQYCLQNKRILNFLNKSGELSDSQFVETNVMNTSSRFMKWIIEMKSPTPAIIVMQNSRHLHVWKDT